ncbi:MAG: hypothetical protein SGPRY_003519 [Prymnesium sp.]
MFINTIDETADRTASMDSFFTANLHAASVAAHFRLNKHGLPGPEPLTNEDFFHLVPAREKTLLQRILLPADAPAEDPPLHLDDIRIESFMEMKSVRDSPYFFIYVLAHHRLAEYTVFLFLYYEVDSLWHMCETYSKSQLIKILALLGLDEDVEESASFRVLCETLLWMFTFYAGESVAEVEKKPLCD